MCKSGLGINCALKSESYEVWRGRGEMPMRVLTVQASMELHTPDILHLSLLFPKETDVLGRRIQERGTDILISFTIRSGIENLKIRGNKVPALASPATPEGTMMFRHKWINWH